MESREEQLRREIDQLRRERNEPYNTDKWVEDNMIREREEELRRINDHY